MQRVLIVLISSLSVTACSKDKPAEVTITAAEPPRSTSVSPGPTPATDARLEPAVVWKGVGLATPESVLYDAAADEYLVSNVEGEPLIADGGGFIARLSPDGKVAKPKWIERLDAPKGMAFARDNLYVTDIDKVRIFDRKTGAPKGEVKIPGGTFVNDAVSAADGRVVVSDTGTSGNDAVYAIEKDDKKVTTIARTKDLGGPNGLLLSAASDKVWVAGFKSGELYSVDAKGAKADVQKLPKGALDGLVALPNGDFLVSSWDASGIYRGRPGGTFTLVIDGVKAPADIGYDPKRRRVLVPMFKDDEVRAYALE
jgi:DNA-binding beta-propeller fold protein YncE